MKGGSTTILALSAQGLVMVTRMKAEGVVGIELVTVTSMLDCVPPG
jgi:hypothetical protein